MFTTCAETSRNAYARIKAEGLLSKMQFLVYEYVHAACRPCTGAELEVYLREVHGGLRHYHQRLSELERVGVIEKVGERKCSVTGFVAYEWAVTGRVPRKEGVERVGWKARALEAERLLEAVKGQYGALCEYLASFEEAEQKCTLCGMVWQECFLCPYEDRCKSCSHCCGCDEE